MFKVKGSAYTTRICATSVACPSCHLYHINMAQKQSMSLRLCQVLGCKTSSQEKKTMSVKKFLSLTKAEEAKRLKGHEAARKRRRSFDLCFSYPELPMERGKSLKEMDSEKLKTGIKKWANAVVAYARTVSGRFGSWRR